MSASLPMLDQRTGARVGGYHSEYKPTDTFEQAADTLEAAYTMYQLVGRQDPEQEVDFSQDGGPLVVRDTAVQMWPNASGADADASRIHSFHNMPVTKHDGVLLGGYKCVKNFGLEELNSGTTEDTESWHEYQQLVVLTFPDGEDDAVTITERDMEGLQPTKFLSNNIIDFHIKYLKRETFLRGR